MEETRHISIRIAGQSFGLDIKKGQEETVREAERNFNKLWAKWSTDFHDRKPQEVLAMVAFQYARYYYSLNALVKADEQAIVDFEKYLDDILLDVK